MTGNGIETNIIYELSYANNMLELINEWPVLFEYAHGIHFDEISGNVFVVSKTNDYIAKINPNTKLVIVSNPGHTGTVIEEDEIVKILNRNCFVFSSYI